MTVLAVELAMVLPIALERLRGHPRARVGGGEALIGLGIWHALTTSDPAFGLLAPRGPDKLTV